MTWLSKWLDDDRHNRQHRQYQTEPIPHVVGMVPEDVARRWAADVAAFSDKLANFPNFEDPPAVSRWVADLDQVRRARLLLDIEWWAHRIDDDWHRTLVAILPGG